MAKSALEVKHPLNVNFSNLLFFIAFTIIGKYLFIKGTLLYDNSIKDLLLLNNMGIILSKITMLFS